MRQENHSSKTAIVTGGTGAIGKAIALELARFGFRVVLISRTAEKCLLAAAEIIQATGNQMIDCRTVDLSRKQSVSELASSWRGPLSVLVNNAAIAPKMRTETPDGIELQFATNVLGYFWMSEYFKPILEESAPARIVNVASYWAGGLDLNDLEFEARPYDNHAAYRQSKQANRMLTPVLAEIYQSAGIDVNACHPGDVNSTLSNDLGFGGSQSPAAGASTPAWLAAEAALEGVTGKYFENQRIKSCQFAHRMEEAEALYDICQSYSR